MKRTLLILFLVSGWLGSHDVKACSVVYYVDSHTGKIYVVNNEDYWYDVEAYIRIMPGSGNKLARLWYGWDDFAQGGINEAGLFFDGALTPEQELPEGGRGPDGNLGDDILARCRTVDEALDILAERKIALHNAHMMFGDSSGKAVVVEWLDGQKKILPMENNRLIMTNFLLSDTARGNHPCLRYESIEHRLDHMEAEGGRIDIKAIGNAMGGAVQVPRSDKDGRVGGTLYTTFINISDMEFMLVHKLDNTKITQLNLGEEFRDGSRRKIKLN